MPDTTPRPPAGSDDDPAYETDTFSRNDGEGRPGPDLKSDPRSFAAGEEGEYETDTFSRNDAEGEPGLPADDGEITAAEADAGDDSDGEDESAIVDGPLKAADSAET